MSVTTSVSAVGGEPELSSSKKGIDWRNCEIGFFTISWLEKNFKRDITGYQYELYHSFVAGFQSRYDLAVFGGIKLERTYESSEAAFADGNREACHYMVAFENRELLHSNNGIDYEMVARINNVVFQENPDAGQEEEAFDFYYEEPKGYMVEGTLAWKVKFGNPGASLHDVRLKWAWDKGVDLAEYFGIFRGITISKNMKLGLCLVREDLAYMHIYQNRNEKKF